MSVGDVVVESNATSAPVPIPASASSGGPNAAGAGGRPTRTPSPNGVSSLLAGAQEGPITPRNDVGPWVFDGSAGQDRGVLAAAAREAPTAGMVSLDAAANASSRQRSGPGAGGTGSELMDIDG